MKMLRSESNKAATRVVPHMFHRLFPGLFHVRIPVILRVLMAQGTEQIIKVSIRFNRYMGKRYRTLSARVNVYTHSRVIGIF